MPRRWMCVCVCVCVVNAQNEHRNCFTYSLLIHSSWSPLIHRLFFSIKLYFSNMYDSPPTLYTCLCHKHRYVLAWQEHKHERDNEYVCRGHGYAHSVLFIQPSQCHYPTQWRWHFVCDAQNVHTTTTANIICTGYSIKQVVNGLFFF